MDLSSAAAREFDSQLGIFKSALVPKYKLKSKLAAEREGLRFQYLTGIRAKLQTLFAAMYSRVYELQNGAAENLLRSFLGSVQFSVPMTALNGSPSKDWGGQLYSFGGTYMVGFLSPNEHWLSLPMMTEPESFNHPPYQLYNLASYSAENVLQDYFLRFYGTDAARNFSFPISVNAFTTWMNAAMRTRDALLDLEIDTVVGIVNGEYSGVSLSSVLAEAKTLLTAIIDKTKALVSLQLDIDEVEKQLAEFVESFKSQIPNLASLDEILASFKSVAEQPSPSVPVIEAGEPVSAVPAEPLKKPVWPIAVAAAAGLFLALQGGEK